MLRHAVALVDRTGVFSHNEIRADVSTAHLKYALAPFYLAEVVSRTRTPDPSSRLPVVTEAAENHELFLSTCERHELVPEDSVYVASRQRQREGTAADPATQRAEKVGPSHQSSQPITRAE